MSVHLRKLKAYVLGHNTDVDSTTATLRDAAVPVSTDECRTCADPCDVGHDEYPARFDMDLETQMLGSMNAYHRQVVISTGKSDWAREVTDVSGTLAAFLNAHPPSSAPKHANGDAANAVAGVWDPGHSEKVTILNGSHHTVADDPESDTVLVLPDYKLVRAVERSKKGAEELWRHAVDPGVGRAGSKDETELRSWVLPYSCVILLCSHKKRDNRCAISAPKLAHGLTVSLEREGWEVHSQIDDPADFGAPLEELEGDDDARDAAVLEQLKSHAWEHADTKRALVLYVSHIGGHKFAGNVIIYTPQGAGVWYGRVTPHHCDAIVRETIEGGKIFPSLLRGGINITRPGRTSLNDW